MEINTDVVSVSGGFKLFSDKKNVTWLLNGTIWGFSTVGTHDNYRISPLHTKHDSIIND